MNTESTLTRKDKKFRSTNVLIVEDNDDHWSLIQTALAQALPGVDCVRVATTEQAMTYLNGCTGPGRLLPRLILLDLYVPNREDGWALLRQIKTGASAFRQVPVIVLSYSSDTDDIADSYLYGGTSYVTKPHDAPAWKTYVEALRTYWWETVTLPSDR